MQIASRLAMCVASLCLGSSLPYGQGKLWIVDKAGAPGFDFTEIQPAVDAAGEGDTVVIRTSFPSHYAGFTVEGKSLVIKAEVGHYVQVEDSVVRNLSAAESVTLRGLEISQATLLSSDGPILLEEVGVSTIFFFCNVLKSQLIISDCDAVVLSRCTLQGYGGTTSGLPGVSISHSTVHMYETDARGSQPSVKHTKGGSGVQVLSGSFLFASGGTIMGGCGADGDLLTCAGSAASGGSGLEVAFGATVYVLGVTLMGGPPGSDCFGGVPPGVPSTGSFNLVAGFPRDYSISSLADGGSTAAITYDGQAADLVFSLVALDAEPLFLLDLAGTLVPSIPPILVAHGPADASGALSTTVPLPLLPAGWETFQVYVQGAAISPAGAAVLGAPSQLTIL
jgi:hypothetical protein